MASRLSKVVHVDPTWIRVALVLLSLVNGAGIVIYTAMWFFIPLEGEDAAIAQRATKDRRGIALGLALLPILVGMIVFGRVLHRGVVSSAAWPVFLVSTGGLLIWRNASASEQAFLRQAVQPVLRLGGASNRTLMAGRIVGGVTLAATGTVILVRSHVSPISLYPFIGALFVVGAFVVVFGPWWFCLVRELVLERQARVRAEERADMATRVHDSVLQTLALIQRSADDPQRVTQLARGQERELRSWLFDHHAPGSLNVEEAASLSAGLSVIERRVAADHGANVEIATVGDCPMSPKVAALLLATQEATINAAKFSGVDTISIFAEVEGDNATVFIRDCGAGFDRDSVDADRHGISDSIEGRMTRQGGCATITSTVGSGTEVELTMGLGST